LNKSFRSHHKKAPAAIVAGAFLCNHRFDVGDKHQGQEGIKMLKKMIPV